MSEVFTRFNRTPRATTPSGSDYLTTYQEEIKDGVKA